MDPDTGYGGPRVNATRQLIPSLCSRLHHAIDSKRFQIHCDIFSLAYWLQTIYIYACTRPARVIRSPHYYLEFCLFGFYLHFYLTGGVFFFFWLWRRELNCTTTNYGLDSFCILLFLVFMYQREFILGVYFLLSWEIILTSYESKTGGKP